MIEKTTGLKSSRASELIKVMLDNGIVEPMQGTAKISETGNLRFPYSKLMRNIFAKHKKILR